MIAWLMAGAALAQNGSIELVETQGPPRDRYVFAVESCEGLKGLAPQPDVNQIRAPELDLLLVNNGQAICTWTGVSLNGFLKGGYKVLPQIADDAAIVLAPGAQVLLRVRPQDYTLPHGDVTIQIPPGKGILVFHGYAPGETPPPPPTAAVPPAPEDPKKAKKKAKK